MTADTNETEARAGLLTGLLAVLRGRVAALSESSEPCVACGEAALIRRKTCAYCLWAHRERMAGLTRPATGLSGPAAGAPTRAPRRPQEEPFKAAVAVVARRTRKALEGPCLLRRVSGYEWVAWEGWTACPEGQRGDRTRREPVPIEEPFKIASVPKKKTPHTSMGALDSCEEDSTPAAKGKPKAEVELKSKSESRPKPKRMSRKFSRVDVDMDVVVELKAEGLRLDLTPEEVLMLALRAAKGRLTG